MELRLHFLLFLIPFAGYGQSPPDSTITGLYTYFSRSPLDRVHTADSLIRGYGSMTLLSWYETDLHSLLDDTSRLHDCYSMSGVMWRVSSYDDAKLKSLTSKWKRLIRRKRFSKAIKPLPEIDYLHCFTAADSLTAFFESYISLSVAARIDYFETHCNTMDVACSKVICTDLNAVSGHKEWPFTKNNNHMQLNDSLARASTAVWKKELNIE